jgi:hypothetical protein
MLFWCKTLDYGACYDDELRISWDETEGGGDLISDAVIVRES